jgi:hypothetical protein
MCTHGRLKGSREFQNTFVRCGQGTAHRCPSDPSPSNGQTLSRHRGGECDWHGGLLHVGRWCRCLHMSCLEMGAHSGYGRTEYGRQVFWKLAKCHRLRQAAKEKAPVMQERPKKVGKAGDCPGMEVKASPDLGKTRRQSLC